MTKRYTHWLKITNARRADLAKQYKEIEKYLASHPESKAEMYYYDYDLFSKVVMLICDENYNDLGMMVNSGFHSLQRLVRKPRNIRISKTPTFNVPKWLAD